MRLIKSKKVRKMLTTFSTLCALSSCTITVEGLERLPLQQDGGRDALTDVHEDRNQDTGSIDASMERDASVDRSLDALAERDAASDASSEDAPIDISDASSEDSVDAASEDAMEEPMEFGCLNIGTETTFYNALTDTAPEATVGCVGEDQITDTDRSGSSYLTCRVDAATGVKVRTLPLTSNESVTFEITCNSSGEVLGELTVSTDRRSVISCMSTGFSGTYRIISSDSSTGTYLLEICIEGHSWNSTVGAYRVWVYVRVRED